MEVCFSSFNLFNLFFFSSFSYFDLFSSKHAWVFDGHKIKLQEKQPTPRILVTTTAMSNIITNNNTPVAEGPSLEGAPPAEVTNAIDLIDFASAVGQAAAATASSSCLSVPEMRAKGARLIAPGFTIPGGNWVL